MAVWVVVFLGLAAAYSFTRVPTYSALSEVLVQPASTSQAVPVSLDTEARLVTSERIAQLARQELGTQLGIPALLTHVSVETTAETLVLDISFRSTEPEAAAAGADAFARAYLQYKQDRALDSVVEERKGFQNSIDDLVLQRDAQNRILQSADPSGLAYLNAQAQRETLSSQIAILTAQLAQIPVTIDPGQVILHAAVPRSPSSPKHALNIALGLFLGLFVGVVGAFVRDRMDDRVRGRSDLQATMRAPVLAAIPHIHGWHRHGPVWLRTEQKPESSGAEAYRTLRAGVMSMGGKSDMRVIAIVGAGLGEGKSTTAANLAAALAQADKRVLAVSADLRKPRLHEFFHLPNERGLSEVLSEQGSLSLDAVVHKYSANLHLITSGSVPAHPAELLQSRRMAEMVALMRERYDVIIIDTPPLLGLADTLSIAPLVDGILLVAQDESSKRAELQQAMEQLQQIGVKIDGCVLTNAVHRRLRSYGYGYGLAEES